MPSACSSACLAGAQVVLSSAWTRLGCRVTRHAFSHVKKKHKNKQMNAGQRQDGGSRMTPYTCETGSIRTVSVLPWGAIHVPQRIHLVRLPGGREAGMSGGASGGEPLRRVFVPASCSPGRRWRSGLHSALYTLTLYTLHSALCTLQQRRCELDAPTRHTGPPSSWAPTSAAHAGVPCMPWLLRRRVASQV